MVGIMDKRDRAVMFRARLAEAMSERGMNRSELARATASNARSFFGLA